MCGRYVLYNTSSVIQKHFELVSKIDFKARYNIAPGQNSVVIHKPENIDFFNWGFTPNWLKKPIINARFETILTKDIFRKSLTKRRCVVPNNGWFEWKNKTPYFIRPSKDEIIGFAGIWDSYEMINKYVILTKPSYGMIASIHHRSPIVLRKQDYHKWLYGSIEDAMNIADYPCEKNFQINEVSKNINNIKNDNYKLIYSI